MQTFQVAEEVTSCASVFKISSKRNELQAHISVPSLLNTERKRNRKEARLILLIYSIKGYFPPLHCGHPTQCFGKKHFYLCLRDEGMPSLH